MHQCSKFAIAILNIYKGDIPKEVRIKYLFSEIFPINIFYIFKLSLIDFIYNFRLEFYFKLNY
jgi:hypothetical protein